MTSNAHDPLEQQLRELMPTEPVSPRLRAAIAASVQAAAAQAATVHSACRQPRNPVVAHRLGYLLAALFGLCIGLGGFVLLQPPRQPKPTLTADRPPKLTPPIEPLLVKPSNTRSAPPAGTLLAYRQAWSADPSRLDRLLDEDADRRLRPTPPEPPLR